PRPPAVPTRSRQDTKPNGQTGQMSAFDETGEVAARGIPRFDDEPHLTGGVAGSQPREELFERGPGAFGHDHHATVGMIRRVPDEPEFECAGTREPAETDPLDAAVHPRRE